MYSIVRLFFLFITLAVTGLTFLTNQQHNRTYLTLVFVLTGVTLAVFLLLNILERREAEKAEKEKKHRSRTPASRPPSPRNGSSTKGSSPADSSSLRKEQKSGLTWGGGNIHASNATRGTRRKFLGK
ncbi:MAG: hypothetical protein R2751_04710 [Bacteroidales bacterium]